MKKAVNKFKQKKLDYKILVVLFITFIITIIIGMWLGDDAFISFRTVKNFINGDGLTWNTFERVQAFTNPLQVLILSGLCIFTKELIFTSIIFNLIASIIAVYLLLFKISKNHKISIIIIILILMSKSFLAFTTSGLETSLTFLLLSIFYYIFFKYKTYDKKRLLLLGFIASLLLLNRMDSILLVLPSLIYAFFVKKDKQTSIIKSISIGLLSIIPFIAWEIFSFIYYGFFFPNTMYAKTNLDFPQIELIINGLKYIHANLILDFITAIIPIIAIILLFTNQIENKIKYLSLGILLSIIYIIYVGGDFMLARFLTPAFLVSLIVLSQIKIKKSSSNRKKYILLILIIISVFSITHTYSINRNTFGLSMFDKSINKVLDEQAFYYNYTSPIRGANDNNIYDNMDPFKEKKYNNVWIAYTVGVLGYYSPKDIIIIDDYALTDPLLSRMPTKLVELERIGHNERIIPKGYAKSLKINKNVIEDKRINEYYDKIIIITRGKIFTKKRFKTIINFNLGKYDYLINNIQRYEIETD